MYGILFIIKIFVRSDFLKNILCLRCQSDMKHIGARKIQLGETGWILGDLPNLFAGAMEVDIYSCPDCGKIEFFQTEESTINTRQCPNCGQKHEFDYPKCPFCKYNYYE